MQARAFERFTLDVPIRATISAATDPSDLHGRVKDLGGGGVKIESTGEIPGGRPVTLTMWTRWGSVSLVGKVVWRRPTNGETAHGFRFDAPIGDARARELYDELSARGYGPAQQHHGDGER